MNFAAPQNGSEGLAVFTNGLREFEVIKRDDPANSMLITFGKKETIALTLFRSIGFLGKEKMLLRPGRPSGVKMPTLDSQVRGKQHCHFSLFNKAIDGAVLSAVKKAEDHDALIVRFYNASETEVIANDRIHFSKPVTQWQEVRMDETLVDGTDKAAGELGGLLLTQTPSFMVGF